MTDLPGQIVHSALVFSDHCRTLRRSKDTLELVELVVFVRSSHLHASARVPILSVKRNCSRRRSKAAFAGLSNKYGSSLIYVGSDASGASKSRVTMVAGSTSPETVLVGRNTQRSTPLDGTFRSRHCFRSQLYAG